MIPPSTSSLLGLSAVVSAAWAVTDAVVEPKNFDVVNALLDLGVDVAEIPALVDNTKRSAAGCAAAVSEAVKRYPSVLTLIVQITQVPLWRRGRRDKGRGGVRGLHRRILVREPR